MPRGVKGSGKKPVNSKKPATEKKERKAYPTYQERIEAADKKMEQLQKLIASREALISLKRKPSWRSGKRPWPRARRLWKKLLRNGSTWWPS